MKYLKAKVKYLLTAIVFFISVYQINAQIVSAPAGGNWTDPLTWVGSTVPSASDSVIITSTVLVNSGGASCNGIYITSTGSLQNSSVTNYILNVNGSITNEGVIQNNVYNFTLNVNGNIYQNGTWSNFHTYLLNSTSQIIEASQPFTGQNFTNSSVTNTLNVNTDISFVNTIVNFNLATVNVIHDGIFSISGASLQKANFQSTHMFFEMLGNAYVQECTFPDVTTSGIVNFSMSNVFNGVLINSGTLQNRSITTYTINVNNDIINNGIIQNNVYNLHVILAGNITNNGTWTNYQNTLTGDEQELTFNQPFAASFLTRTPAPGNIIAQSDLYFDNTFIDLNNDTVDFQSGFQITVEGGYLIDAVLLKNTLPALELEGLANAYVQNLKMDVLEAELSGTINVGVATNTFKGNITLSGTLQNRVVSSYILNIDGDFINNGSVNNNVYNLTLNISGDIENNGIWSNYYTNFTGADDQHIIATNMFSGANYKNQNLDGMVYADSDISFSGSNIDFDYDTLKFDQGSKLMLNNSYLTETDIIKTALNPDPFELSMNGSRFERCEFVADSIYLMGDVRYAALPINFYGNVVVTDSLRNYQVSSYSSTITGSLTNKGLIANNVYSNTLNLSGDFHNYGTVTNYFINLNGDNHQQLYFFNEVACANLSDINSNGHLVAQTNLTFNGTNIDFNNDTLVFESGAELTLNACFLNESVIVNSPAKSSDPFGFTLTDGSNFARTKIVSSEMNFYGVILVNTPPIEFHGNVNNYGELKNYQVSNYSAITYGDLNNYGSITNNVYQFTLYLHGGISQSGVWQNQNTYLEGTTDHSFTFTEKFKGYYLTNNNPVANLTATTDLLFDGTAIDLNGCDLSLPDLGLLSVQNGYLDGASVIGNDIQFHNQNAYCINSDFSNVTLYGDVLASSNVIFNGDVIVEGSLRNRPVTNSQVTVQGDLYNNGNISNNVYNLYLTCLGNLHNNGTWNNIYTLLDGSVDQYIYIRNGNSIVSQLRLDANYGGPWTWYGGSFVGPLSTYPSDFSFSTSQVLYFLNPIDASYFGTYYCTDGVGTFSRNFHIMDETIADYQLDITVMLEGPFNGTDMNTTLNAEGSLPLSQPYLDYPWTYPGGENVGAIPNGNIVDWVNIELRDAVDANSADNSATLEKLSAFVLNDGQIVGLDGISLPRFYEPVTNDLFVVIKHRNHLDIMSALALTESAGVYSYDFSFDSSDSYGGPLATKNLTNEITPVYGMMSGDADKDGSISLADQAQWPFMAGKHIGYEQSDFNLDGQIENKDKNDFWLINTGQSIQYPQ